MPSKGNTLLSAWKAMKQRCDNPNNPGYTNYGGRGITYAPEWKHYFNPPG